MLDLSILVISSPSPSHPSTCLVESCLDSLSFLPEIQATDSLPILFILDGYIVAPKSRTKRGRVTASLAEKYEEYKLELGKYLTSHTKWVNHRVVCLNGHYGFAHAVKEGLQQIRTKYCLIAQHDRVFMTRFDGLNSLISTMETNTHIRYIGFPSITNNMYNNIIQTKYRLTCLNTKEMIVTVDEDRNIYLQPLLFWFDSQHLCHVERYLQIFSPYRNIPLDLRGLFGKDLIGKMVLRKGDFIEDRFGQGQLNSIVKLRDHGDVLVKRAFLWYGSYLVWVPGEPYEREECVSKNEDIESTLDDGFERIGLIQDTYPLMAHRSIAYVRHLNGRTFNLIKELEYEEYRNHLQQVGENSHISSESDADSVDHSMEMFEESQA